ncbi:MAG TPA: pitrilysin family protein [Myxococcaceae bacterium]|nr:pitrilysin family protein [Myxococcaceae bacterium]
METTPRPAKEEAGFFPMPPALAADPRALKIPALDFEVVKPERLTLDNGLTVYLLPDRGAPLVQLSALVYTGSVDEPKEKLGLTDVAFSLMASGGAGALGADALDERLELLAADAGGGGGEEISSLSLNLRSADLDALLPVFADMLLRPRFQKDRFDVTVARYREAVRRRPDSPDGLAHRALRKAVYGPESPFAREPSDATLRALTPADLASLHRASVSPANTALLVTGHFERDAVVPQLKTLFGAWKGGPRRVRQFAEAARQTRRVFWIPKDTAQVKIRIGTFGFERGSPREYAARVLNSAMTSFGVGRMYRELRDRQGLAYAASAVAAPGPRQGLFTAAVDTKPGTAMAAIEGALAILERTAGKDPVSAPEITTAREMYLNSFAFRFDEADKIAQEKAVFDFFGYPDTYLDTFREKITAVDAEAVRALAQDIYRLDALQIVVVGPKSAAADLARFGPVTEVADVDRFLEPGSGQP